MDWASIECIYDPTIMDGPVVRWRLGVNRRMANLNAPPDWSCEVSASRNGVMLSGSTGLMETRTHVGLLVRVLELAGEAYLDIRTAVDEHATAQRIVEDFGRARDRVVS